MNIAIITNGYPTSKEPQYGCFERDQAVALQKMGHKITILYVDGRLRKMWRKIGVTHIVENGIDVYNVFLFPTFMINRISFKLDAWLKAKMLKMVFKCMLREQERPDLIYAHFLYNIYYATFLKKKYNIPLVGIEHWSVLNQTELPKNIRYCGDIAYSISDKLIAVAASLQKQIYKHFHKDSIVVHNMVGEVFFQKPIINHSINGRISLITVGSLLPRKGFDVLIEALSCLRLPRSYWNLKIVGGGIEEIKLRKLIKRHNLDDNIELVGKKNKQEIITLLHDSDAFILSSRAENFSVAVLEALSVGLPVVATICGGIRECIDERNGILVPVGDVSSLANAITQICINIGRYNRLAIAEECKKRFAPTIIANQLTEIFENVVAKYHSNK